MKLIRTFLTVCLAAVTLTGLCGSTAYYNGWLQDYQRLEHVGGVPIEQVWIQPEFNISNYRVLYIAPVEIDPCAYRRGGEVDRQMAERLAGALRCEMEQQLRSLGIFAFVTTDPYFAVARKGQLTFQTRITEIYRGHPRHRIMFGFGLGSTEVQLEGKLYEQSSCRTFVEFADRRLHGGIAPILGFHTATNSEYLIGIDLKMISCGITKLFVYLREEGPQGDIR